MHSVHGSGGCGLPDGGLYQQREPAIRQRRSDTGTPVYPHAHVYLSICVLYVIYMYSYAYILVYM